MVNRGDWGCIVRDLETLIDSHWRKIFLRRKNKQKIESKVYCKKTFKVISFNKVTFIRYMMNSEQLTTVSPAAEFTAATTREQ